ncbi:MAG: carbamoyl-phosphate synthase large subunit, partial [Duncaniella sp.]|nr:carbamoyl-phosphate synthase large subunit [Duncaniella sp.]
LVERPRGRGDWYMRMIGQGMHGFVGNHPVKVDDIDRALAAPTDKRIFIIAQAMQKGYTVDRIHELTKIDKWFLHKLHNIIVTAGELARYNQLEELPAELLRQAKCQGFSDFQVAREVMKGDMDVDAENANLQVRALRKQLGITPVVKQIDTLAAEYPAMTNYLYLTYNGTQNDVRYLHDHRSIVVLGSGAYRIGSSVEFDWCSVNALMTVKRNGWRSVMINYNPETVSTDYDICDRLYFDELTFERVMDILDLEQPHGTILSVGGQIPNNLATRLDQQGVNILGTSARDIDNAEDRNKFSAMLDRLGIDQPRWSELTSMDDIHRFIDEVGYPVLVRPSYVLSGAAMNVCHNDEQLTRFLRLAANVSKKHPVVVSQFISQAKEIEMDAVARNGEIIAYAISEHIEYAGVHSGDATIQFPPQKLYVETMRRIRKISRRIAEALHISGPFNIQFLAKNNDIKVIECNLRASRSFPFVSKVLKINFIDLATRIMLGLDVEKPGKSAFDLDYVGIKASQFSFSRLQGADPVLGVDMASTGEVGCLGVDSSEALMKALISVGQRIPRRTVLLSTGGPKSKSAMLDAAHLLNNKGYTIYATGGTCNYLNENGIPAIRAYWPSETDRQPQAEQLLHDHKIDLVVNIPKNYTSSELSNGYRIRRAATDLNIPLLTNARLASAFIEAFTTHPLDEIEIKAWDEY